MMDVTPGDDISLPICGGNGVTFSRLDRGIADSIIGVILDSVCGRS